MDFNKLINKNNNGTYCILFKNYHSLDEEEIRTIFSKFGTISEISTCGEKFRLFYFIKYSTYNEAQNAVIELNNHPTIKLLEHRKKTDNKRENNDTAVNGTSPKDKTQLSFENSQAKNINQNDYKKHHRNPQQMNKNYNESTLENISSMKSPKPNSRTENKNLNHSYQNGYNNKNNINDMPSLITINTVKNQSPNSIVRAKNGIQNNVYNRIEDAQEVIVGNIHPNFGVSYILHIFDNFEPIAISKMNKISSVGIRYCHVYFKSIQDSINVEEKFDRMDLSGQKLVVLRLTNLIKEAET